MNGITCNYVILTNHAHVRVTPLAGLASSAQHEMLSQEAYLTVNYNQLFASRVIGPFARPTH